MKTINSIEFNILKASNLGERIKFLRQKLMEEDEKDYTIKAIAKRIDVPFQTLTSVERGDSQKPSIFLMNSIAKDFNVNIEIFLDDYYEGEEKLFSFGDDSDKQVIKVDFDFEEGDLVSTDNIEYRIGSGAVANRIRNIHIFINEELPIGDQKNLYHHKLKLNDNGLMTLLSNFIQQAELNPSSLSYTTWSKALKLSPLRDAYTITNKQLHELPNIYVELEELTEH